MSSTLTKAKWNMGPNQALFRRSAATQARATNRSRRTAGIAARRTGKRSAAATVEATNAAPQCARSSRSPIPPNDVGRHASVRSFGVSNRELIVYHALSVASSMDEKIKTVRPSPPMLRA
jgi:hypothetical protein